MGFSPSDTQKLEFIREIAPYAQSAYKTLGKVLPSICIGMACVESGFGYGTDGSRLMYKHNAILGQKVGLGKTALKYWGGKFWTAKTSEEYQVGVHSVINAAFRGYDNLEQCIFNYYELLNTPLYSKVKGGANYATQMSQIKACGYMTSSTEVNSVKNVIQKYGLTRYDIEVGAIAASQDDSRQEYEIKRVYTLDSDLYIRDEPDGQKLKHTCITNDAKMHSHFDEFGNAILNKGTRVTCLAITELTRSTWMLIPSGWICAKSGGQIYVR